MAQAPAQPPQPQAVIAMPAQALNMHFERLENELRAQSLSRDTKKHTMVKAPNV